MVMMTNLKNITITCFNNIFLFSFSFLAFVCLTIDGCLSEIILVTSAFLFIPLFTFAQFHKALFLFSYFYSNHPFFFIFDHSFPLISVSNFCLLYLKFYSNLLYKFQKYLVFKSLNDEIFQKGQ
jgi:hypothetical protein